MRQVTIEDLSGNLHEFLERAEAGEAIGIVRHGREVARLLPPEIERAQTSDPPAQDGEAHTADGLAQPEPKRLPDLTEFRRSIEIRGEPLSETVIRERRESRY